MVDGPDERCCLAELFTEFNELFTNAVRFISGACDDGDHALSER